MTRRRRGRRTGVIARRLVRVERAVLQVAMVPVIAVAERRITRTFERQS